MTLCWCGRKCKPKTLVCAKCDAALREWVEACEAERLAKEEAKANGAFFHTASHGSSVPEASKAVTEKSCMTSATQPNDTPASKPEKKE